jgi:hypothetical protein
MWLCTERGRSHREGCGSDDEGRDWQGEEVVWGRFIRQVDPDVDVDK